MSSSNEFQLTFVFWVVSWDFSPPWTWIITNFDLTWPYLTWLLISNEIECLRSDHITLHTNLDSLKYSLSGARKQYDKERLDLEVAREERKKSDEEEYQVINEQTFQAMQFKTSSWRESSDSKLISPRKTSNKWILCEFEIDHPVYWVINDT